MSAPEVVCPAPAKLNLFLHVNARRADGYHELQTVFQLLDRGDVVRVRLRSDGRIARAAPLPGVPEDADLTVRAARLVAAHAGGAAGADLEVRKRLPMGAGLGGGSADAAATLLALDRLWRLDLGTDTLAALGLQLGADVPLFVRRHSAWGEGVGERLVPVRIEPAWYAVVTPPVQVATAAVFSDGALTRNTPRTTISDLLRGSSVERGASADRLSVVDVLERTVNDCEPVARRLYPLVDEALDWLCRRARARMTGTGSSVFALADGATEAEALLEGLPAGWAGFVAQGVDESPAPSR